MAKANTQKLLQRMKYINKLDTPYEFEYHSKELDHTFYWNAAPAATQSQYAADLLSQNYARAYPKMIYFRSIDASGNRLFTEQTQFDVLMKEVDINHILAIGNAMVESDSQTSTKEQEAEAVKN